MTDAVGPSWVALPQAGSWFTVLGFLLDRFPHVAEAEWRERMQRGEVLSVQAEHLQTLNPLSPYAAGLRVRYLRHVAQEARIPFEAQLLFEDAHIVVADKPHFLPVTPSGHYVQETLLARLRQALQCDTLAPMHRLDRDTAGLVLLSKQVTTRGAYHALFSQRQAQKIYHAVAPWHSGLVLTPLRSSRLETAAHFMQMQESPGEPNAHTRMRVLEHSAHWARYELQPITGKRHQLRVHMAALGLPIRFDGIYPVLTPAPLPGSAPDYSRPLQLLAKELCFTDPLSGQERSFISRQQLLPLPEAALARVLAP